jgi:hypothetical protein
MNAKSSSLFSPMLMAMNSMGNLPNTSLPKAPGSQSGGLPAILAE